MASYPQYVGSKSYPDTDQYDTFPFDNTVTVDKPGTYDVTLQPDAYLAFVLVYAENSLAGNEPPGFDTGSWYQHNVDGLAENFTDADSQHHRLYCFSKAAEGGDPASWDVTGGLSGFPIFVGILSLYFGDQADRWSQVFSSLELIQRGSYVNGDPGPATGVFDGTTVGSVTAGDLGLDVAMYAFGAFATNSLPDVGSVFPDSITDVDPAISAPDHVLGVGAEVNQSSDVSPAVSTDWFFRGVVSQNYDATVPGTTTTLSLQEQTYGPYPDNIGPVAPADVMYVLGYRWRAHFLAPAAPITTSGYVDLHARKVGHGVPPYRLTNNMLGRK